LIPITEAVERGIFDELADSPEELMEKAKAKIVALIDTPGRPFIALKQVHREHHASIIRKGIDEMDWNSLVKVFTDEKVIGTLNMVKGALGI
jgi:enoyl-CoA hydratase/carnithine racemase